MNLQQENIIALQLIQALLGLVSRSILAISFSVVGEEIDLYFLFESDSEPNIEDIEDVKFELDVLTDGKYKISHSVCESGNIRLWDGQGHRHVLKRKEMNIASENEIQLPETNGRGMKP